MNPLPKTCLLVLLTSLSVLMTPCLVQAQLEGKECETPVRVGTFDSRAVALAYYRSTVFSEKVGQMRDQLAEAKEAGNNQRADELELQGVAMQKLAHQQGFSTQPIDNILATLEKQLPEIAKQTGVHVIVSRWDIVWQDSAMEFVDVTPLMVDPFAPTPETRKAIEAIREKPPVPIEQIRD